MGRTFTEFVRRLEPGAPPPEDSVFIELWSTLRGCVRAELRQRGLLAGSPAWLGVPGFRFWCEEALDDLTSECYSFIFVSRLRSLRAHLQIKPNVDGLVFLALRQFLHERQRRSDPLGFRIYEVLREAVQAAVKGGSLSVASGDPEIGNDTLLALAEPARARQPASLAEVIPSWNDDLIPRLLKGSARDGQGPVDLLCGRLAHLGAAGFDRVRFKDLIDSLKSDARNRWVALAEQEGGETAFEADADSLPSIVRLVRPDSGLEEADAFQKLTGCVRQGVEGMDCDERTRRYLSLLWGHLVAYATETGPAGRWTEWPSDRHVAEALDIPRRRLPDLYAALGRLVSGCRAAQSAQPPVSSPSEERDTTK
jgi:hypothetical protein